MVIRVGERFLIRSTPSIVAHFAQKWISRSQTMYSKLIRFLSWTKLFTLITVHLSMSIPTIPSLNTTRECADGLYDHYDVNRIIRNEVPVNRLNVPNVVAALDNLAKNLRARY